MERAGVESVPRFLMWRLSQAKSSHNSHLLCISPVRNRAGRIQSTCWEVRPSVESFPSLSHYFCWRGQGNRGWTHVCGEKHVPPNAVHSPNTGVSQCHLWCCRSLSLLHSGVCTVSRAGACALPKLLPNEQPPLNYFFLIGSKSVTSVPKFGVSDTAT